MADQIQQNSNPTAAPTERQQDAGQQATEQPASILGDAGTQKQETQKGTSNEQAKTEAPKGNQPPPAELDLKVPDGAQISKELLEQFKPLAKELGLQSVQAQKLVDLVASSQKQEFEKFQQHVIQQDAAWKSAVKADKELGGQNYEATGALCRKAINALGGDELRKTIDELGIGNHPVLVRAFARAGKALSEDSIAGGIGSGANGATAQEKADQHLRQMFPSMFPTT